MKKLIISMVLVLFMARFVQAHEAYMPEVTTETAVCYSCCADDATICTADCCPEPYESKYLDIEPDVLKDLMVEANYAEEREVQKYARENKVKCYPIGSTTCTFLHCGDGYWNEFGEWISPPACNTCTQCYKCDDGKEICEKTNH